MATRVRTAADRYDALTVELQEELEAVFFSVLKYCWSLKDARTADELGPRHWEAEAERYHDWSGDDVLIHVQRINCLTRRAIAAGESLVNGRG